MLLIKKKRYSILMSSDVEKEEAIMKEFLRFLMCVIIVATLVFVYMFLTSKNNDYSNNGSTEDIIVVSGDIENSGDKEVENKNIFSGDDSKNNVESGENIDKPQIDDNKPIIEDNKKDEHQEVKPVEEMPKNNMVADPEISGDASL